MVFSGLMIRINLKGFNNSYVKLIEDDYDDNDNQININSLKRAKPWVLYIWAALVLEATLGIVKQGAPVDLTVMENLQSN